jgi:hypothetical protein
MPGFDLHPDGQRFAVLKAAHEPTAVPQNQVVLIPDFIDGLRRIGADSLARNHDGAGLRPGRPGPRRQSPQGGRSHGLPTHAITASGTADP